VPEFVGTLIVVLKREMGDFLQALRMQFHIHLLANCVPSACSVGSELVETPRWIDPCSSPVYFQYPTPRNQSRTRRRFQLIHAKVRSSMHHFGRRWRIHSSSLVALARALSSPCGTFG